MTPVAQTRRRRWESVAAAALLLLVAWAAWRWTQSLGGPSAIGARFGPWAPAVSVPAHVVLSATPFPSELIGVANGSVYGLWLGTLYGWIGWWSGAMIEYLLVRRGLHGERADPASLGAERARTRLPRWVARLPVGHPAALITVRFLPLGFHAVNILAAASGVSVARQASTAAISNLLFAFLAAATGASLVKTGLV